MKLRGEDVAASMREWCAANVKESGNRAYDLGKFLFTVSSGSIPILASLQKLDPAFQPRLWSLVPYGLFLLSLLFALNLVFPRNRRLKDDENIIELYQAELKFVTQRLRVWFSVWFAGLLLSIVSLIFSGVDAQ